LFSSLNSEFKNKFVKKSETLIDNYNTQNLNDIFFEDNIEILSDFINIKLNINETFKNFIKRFTNLYKFTKLDERTACIKLKNSLPKKIQDYTKKIF